MKLKLTTYEIFTTVVMDSNFDENSVCVDSDFAKCTSLDFCLSRIHLVERIFPSELWNVPELSLTDSSGHFHNPELKEHPL